MGKMESVRKLMLDSLKNNEKIPVHIVTEMFIDITDKMLSTKGTALYIIKEELGNNMVRKLLGELSGSLIGSIHMSSTFKDDIESAKEYAEKIGADEINFDIENEKMGDA